MQKTKGILKTFFTLRYGSFAVALLTVFFIGGCGGSDSGPPEEATLKDKCNKILDEYKECLTTASLDDLRSLMVSCPKGGDPVECQKKMDEVERNATNFPCAKEKVEKWDEMVKSVSEEQRAKITSTMSLKMGPPGLCLSEATVKGRLMCMIKAGIDVAKEKTCNTL